MIGICKHGAFQQIKFVFGDLPTKSSIFPFIVNVKYFSDGRTKTSKISINDEITVSKEITKEEVEKFSVISGDTNIIHSVAHQETAIVHGAYLNSLVSGVIGTKLPGHGSIVIEQILHFPNKCYVGETVDITVKLITNRKILKVDYYCDVKEKNKRVLFGSAKLVKSF